MMKQSSLLRWTHNTRATTTANKNKTWIHPPEALQGGHVAYLVKYLGCTDVDKPKGIEVVKEGIRKLKFNQYLKKSEGSTAKIPKVELTISIDGVAIQDPKTRVITDQYPLHRISYCADDKSDKKFFSFVAKESEEKEKPHRCFVFISDKLAEEITLTIGQAFDLAYRRFLDTSGRELEMRRQIMLLQKKVKELETENQQLRQKLADTNNNSPPHTKQQPEMKTPPPSANGNHARPQHNGIIPLLQPPPAHPPRHHSPGGGQIQQLDLLGSSPPSERDLFGAEPFNPRQNDPFEMGDFRELDLDHAIGAIDRKLSEMRAGFSQGLTFGNEDFALESAAS